VLCPLVVSEVRGPRSGGENESVVGIAFFGSGDFPFFWIDGVNFIENDADIFRSGEDGAKGAGNVRS